MLRKLAQIGFFVGCFVSAAQGQTTYTSPTCNLTDVQTTFNTEQAAKADGDKIIIPAGTCHWTSQFNISPTNSLTIQGQSVIASNDAQGNPATFTDTTQIIDDHNANNALFILNTSSGKIYRVTGLSFASGTNGTVDNGVIQFGGASQSLRVDHCHFSGLNQLQVQTDGVFGVFDHNLFSNGNLATRQLQGGGSGNGDDAWHTTTQLGSNQYIYYENNSFLTQGVAANDCLSGGNFVFRFNTLAGQTSGSSNNNGGQLQTHPTGHTTSDDRGCRKWEIYKNTYSGGTQGFDLFNGMFASAGTGLMWGNTFGPHFSHVLTLHNMRRNNGTYSQAAQPGGWGYCGTSFNGTGSTWDQNSNTSTGYACLDMIGHGIGDQLSGSGASKVNVQLGGQTWPRQALEPVYEWMDTWTSDGSSNNSFVGLNDNGYSQNVDYYTWCDPTSASGCTSFNGTVGVGSGTLAARPATCTTGVGYWATDQGNWNSSGSGGQGQLYRCTSTNTWTLSYTPLAFPHPLTGSTGWTYVQDSLATFCSSGSSCNLTLGNILPTTAGTVWVVLVQDISANGFKISSVTGGGGTWTVCSACVVTGQGRTLSIAYNIGGTAGTSAITVNLTGSSPNLGVNFMEVLPPPGTTPSFDAAGTNVSTNCSVTCPGVGLTITGTDAIIQNLHANNTPVWNSWTSPYLTLPLGEGLALNATSGAAPSAKVDGTGTVTNAIAFTSTAGSFTPPSQPISVVNYSVNTAGINCSPTCSIPIPAAGSGHLMYIEMANIVGSFLSTVTDNGGKTWTVPTGCHIGMSLAGSDTLSCAYLLSSTANTSQVNVTMTGNAGNTFYAVWEIATTTAPFALDQIGSATTPPLPNATNSGVGFCASGCAASALTGSNDVIFQSIFVPGGSSSVGFYPYPRINGQGTQFFNNQAANAALLNTTNGAAPLWVDQQNENTIVTGVAFSSAASSGTPAINLNPSSLSFGNQAVLTSSASQAVTITNTGTSSLTLSSITIVGTNASSFSQTNNCGASLAVNASCTVNVTFTPQTVQNGLTANLTVTSSAPSSPDVAGLTGTGTLTISVSPASLNFFNQFLNTTSSIPQVITVTNQGLGALSISSIVPTASFTETDNCSPSLGAGLTCHINVFFTPTVLGPVTGTVTMTDNAIGSPHVVNVAGTGVKMVSGVGSITGTGTIKVQP